MEGSPRKEWAQVMAVVTGKDAVQVNETPKKKGEEILLEIRVISRHRKPTMKGKAQDCDDQQ